MWQAILGLLKLLFGQRETGRMEAQHESMKATIETQERMTDVDAKGARTSDDVDERLRSGRF